MRIVFLNSDLESEYSEFLLGFEKTMLYASLKYRNLLRDFLNCEDRYLLALDDRGSIIGSLPLFVKENAKYGRIYNSLPFYGSNGAVIANDNDVEVKHALLQQYRCMLNEPGCAGGTVISSPFDDNTKLYDDFIEVDYKDSRIGQITYFPSEADSLMDIFHYKTRNTIRKGIKSGVEVSWENGMEYFDFLFETHKENMSKIGGLYKPNLFFEKVNSNFIYGTDYRIYVATVNGKPVAALLNFYFNKTVEYFTPVTVEAFREYQPMSVLILEAMKDAVKSGYKYWNWGGTWLTQGGVYDFKKRWGTNDLNYYYYTTVKNEALKQAEKGELLSEYPYFFVLPFNQLK